MPKPENVTLTCFRCKRTPDQIEEYKPAMTESSLSPDDFVWAEEGTLNTENGHFACTECYIAVGMPSGSGRGRWIAP